MLISNHHVNEFREIYRREYGRVLTMQEAVDVIINLFKLMNVIQGRTKRFTHSDFEYNDESWKDDLPKRAA